MEEADDRASGGRPRINAEQMVARFSEGTLARIDQYLQDGEKRSEFVRAAVFEELDRREAEIEPQGGWLDRLLGRKPKGRGSDPSESDQGLKFAIAGESASHKNILRDILKRLSWSSETAADMLGVVSDHGIAFRVFETPKDGNEGLRGFDELTRSIHYDLVYCGIWYFPDGSRYVAPPLQVLLCELVRARNHLSDDDAYVSLFPTLDRISSELNASSELGYPTNLSKRMGIRP